LASVARIEVHVAVVMGLLSDVFVLVDAGVS